MTLTELQELASEGLITLRPNHDASLFIANYTPKVQYDRLWTDTIKQCRGLIIHKDGQIIARPFAKFFNIEEHTAEEIPNEPFEVYGKLDGSLGILYMEGWDAKIATRGSFTSEQAIKATEMLNTTYKRFIPLTHPEKTYLFEIIYPSNRIVCDYGKEEKLVLLAIINKDGTEQSIEDYVWPDKATRYDGINDLTEIKNMEDSEKEGFVIRFKSGMRIKSKFSEYVRLHKIITQVSAKSIWEYLKDGKPLNDLIEKVPDEFFSWVKKTSEELQDAFLTLHSEATVDFLTKPICDTRKDFALYAQTKKHPSLLFSLYDNKSIVDQVWKMIKPEYERPFKTEV